MKYSIWKQCKSKSRYRDEHTANHYRKLFERERGRKLDYYCCDICNGYHLTSRMDWINDPKMLEALAAAGVAV